MATLGLCGQNGTVRVKDCTRRQGFSLKQELSSPPDAPRRRQIQEDGLGKGHHIVLYTTEAFDTQPLGMCGAPPGGMRSMLLTPALGGRVSGELGQGFPGPKAGSETES